MVVIPGESRNQRCLWGGTLISPLDKYLPVRKAWQVRNWRSACRNHASVCTLMNAEPDPFPNLPSVMKRREGLPLQHCLVSQVNTHMHATRVTCRLDLPLNYSLISIYKKNTLLNRLLIFAFKALAVLQGVGGWRWVWRRFVQDTGGSQGTQQAEI